MPPENRIFVATARLASALAVALASSLVAFSVLSLQQQVGWIRRCLIWAGTSEFLRDKYATADRVGSMARFTPWVAVAVLGLAVASWMRGALALQIIAQLLGRGNRLLTPRKFDPPTTRWAKLDRLAGMTLLATTACYMIWVMFNRYAGCDEVTMYTSVCSSKLPLWSVAYISPNNHVGYAWMVWLGHFAWGDSLAGMRCFSLVAWFLCAYLLSQISGEVHGSDSPSLVAMALSLPYVVAAGAQARGYLLGAMLINAAVLAILRSRQHLDFVAAGILGGLAMWSVPSHLYGVAVLSGIIAWRRGPSRRTLTEVACFVATSVGLAVVLYSPIAVVSGPSALLSNQWVRPLPWSEFLRGYPAWVASTLLLLFEGPQGKAILACVLISWAIGRGGVKARIPALLALSTLLCPIPQHVLPFTRTLVFMAPLFVVLAGGVGISRFRAAFVAVALAGVVGICLNGIAVPKYAWDASPGAEGAARAVASSPASTVACPNFIDYACLRFYLHRLGWPGKIENSVGTDLSWVFWTIDGAGRDALIQQRSLRPTSVSGLYCSP